MRSEGLQLAIDAMGGVAALAKAVGVTSQAVSQWERVPAERVLLVEKASGVPRWELRPDLYPSPTEDAVASADWAVRRSAAVRGETRALATAASEQRRLLRETKNKTG